MTAEPRFRTDLYAGTAPFYDRFRPPYPQALLDDLCERLPISGQGRLLDLACGTGQIAVPLSGRFAEVVAVDQEAESVAFGRAKAESVRAGNIDWRTGSAETVDVEGPFELVTIGSAFHRLPRQVVADRMMAWIPPGGGLALLWAGTPAEGDLDWQQELASFFIDWMGRAGTSDRVPTNWAAAISADPHEQVIGRAGLEYAGRFEFVEDLSWSIESLIGFAYSTSILNRQALGASGDDFERDLAERLGPYASDGRFHQSARYAYELALRPGRR